jgi:hypothetical protein
MRAHIRPEYTLTHTQVQPGLLYAFITTAHFEEHEHPAGYTSPSAASPTTPHSPSAPRS